MSYCVFQRSWPFLTFACAVSAVNGGAPDMAGPEILGEVKCKIYVQVRKMFAAL